MRTRPRRPDKKLSPWVAGGEATDILITHISALALSQTAANKLQESESLQRTKLFSIIPRTCWLDLSAVDLQRARRRRRAAPHPKWFLWLRTVAASFQLCHLRRSRACGKETGVDRRIAGSSPTWGATLFRYLQSLIRCPCQQRHQLIPRSTWSTFGRR